MANIKKFDIKKYYKELPEFTTIKTLHSGSFLCKTKDYDFEYINYVITKNHFEILNNMIDDFIANNNRFTSKDLEKYISEFTFSVYNKRVAARKLALFFINLNIINKNIRTDNGFNFNKITNKK